MIHLPKSIYGRLLLATGIGIALAIVAIWLSATRLFASHVEPQFHEELEVHLSELVGLVAFDASGRPYLSRPLSDPRFIVAGSGYYWQVDRAGHPRLRSQSLAGFGDDSRLSMRLATGPVARHAVQPGPSGLAETYGLAVADAQGRLTRFTIATDERHLRTVLSQFDRELLVLLGLFALLLTAVMLAVARFAVHPLNRLAEVVNAVREGRSSRIDGDFPREVAPLVVNLNAMITQNGDLVSRARTESANLAHALRTPLAVIQDEAERLEDDEDSVSSARAAVFLAQADRMRVRIDYHLTRARASGPRSIAAQTTHVSDAAATIVSAFARLHPGCTINLDVPQHIRVACDPADFDEILANLIDNAVRHGDGTVGISIATSAGPDVVIQIKNSSLAAVPPNIETLFGIGVRGSSSTDGSGLGLAIARDFARLHGGDVDLAISGHEGTVPGITVTASITLPQALRA